MCTSTLSAGPPIQLPFGQSLIPAKPNPQPQPPSGAPAAAAAAPLSGSGDPNRGRSLDIAV